MIGTVTMKLGSLLVPGEKPFFCDLISFDEQANTGVVWHCGAAAPSLCRWRLRTAFCKHSIIDGGGVKGVSCEFPLKPGRVTLMRIGEDRDGGYRLFWPPAPRWRRSSCCAELRFRSSSTKRSPT